MKQYEDLLKDTNNDIIDAEKLFKEDGSIDLEYLEIVTNAKPIVPNARDETRQKYFSVKENRTRYDNLPDRLPTKDLMPFPVDAHEQIGQYETKHNLYLLIANAYNKLLERIENLENKG